MLELNTMSGYAALLPNTREVEYFESVEGERSLSFFIVKNDKNAEAFDLIRGKEAIMYDGERYIIDECEAEPYGSSVEKEVTCRHEYFEFTRNKFQMSLHTGDLTIVQAMQRALAGTKINFSIEGTYDTLFFENFGEDLSLRMVNHALRRFGAEYRVEGRTLFIAKEFSRVTDNQIRRKHNMTGIVESIDHTDVKTYIEGRGKEVEDAEGNPIPGQYMAHASYLSPNAKLYTDHETGEVDIKQAETEFDNRFTSDASLERYIKTRLKDTPNYYLEVEYRPIKRDGVDVHDIRLGDYILILHEPMGIDLEARVLSVKRRPYEPQTPPIIELGNFRRDVTRTIAQFGNATKQIEAVSNVAQAARTTATQAGQMAREVQGIVNGTVPGITQHMQNANIHVNPRQTSDWDNKETPNGAQDKVNAGVLLSNQYTDEQRALLAAEDARLKQLIIDLTDRVAKLENTEGGTNGG